MNSYEIKKILNQNEKDFQNNPYIYEKINNQYQANTYDKFVKDVKNFAAYLQSENLTKKHIGIYAPNSYNYAVADIAIMGYVGTSVTLSKEWGYYDMDNMMTKFGLDALIYSRDKEDIITQLKDKNPNLICIKIEDILNLGADKNLDESAITITDTAKLIFSSGTTGVPKAVALTQENMFTNFDALMKRAPMNTEDVDYLFLPLSHTYAGICNLLYSIITGMKIYLCSDTTKIAEELQEVKPTVFCTVPLICERFYSVCKEKGISPKMILGPNIKHFFVGGAYFDPEINKFFKDAGVGVLGCYGLSETSSVIAIAYHEDDEFVSVGTIMEEVEVKIDEPDKDGVGEILAKGKNIMKAYYKNAEMTKKNYTNDGFFRTGDLGYIDNENRLYIKGRKKRMILLSNGENVYPDDAEPLIQKFEHVTKAKVYEKEKQIFATVYADEEIDLEPIIESVNQELPKYARIRNFELIRDSLNTRLK